MTYFSKKCMNMINWLNSSLISKLFTQLSSLLQKHLKKKVPFLDLLIYTTEGHLSTRLYIKPRYRHVYLHYGLSPRLKIFIPCYQFLRLWRIHLESLYPSRPNTKWFFYETLLSLKNYTDLEIFHLNIYRDVL